MRRRSGSVSRPIRTIARASPHRPSPRRRSRRGDARPYLQRFRGKFLQTPPPVSAKKIAGRPAYELARKQIAVELEPVEVQVYELKLLGIEGGDIRVRAHCSAGTYLRANRA